MPQLHKVRARVVRIAPFGGRAMTFKPRVTVVEPGGRLEWLGVPGLFDGRHSFTLEAMGKGGTRFVQAEAFSGALTPFTGNLLRKTESGFAAMNAALLSRLQEASSRTVLADAEIVPCR